MKNLKDGALVKNELIQNRIKLLLLEMQYYNFKGTYNIDKNGNIEWNLNDSVKLEIILGGHGGDDLIIIWFVAKDAKVYSYYDEFNTNDNYELIKVLKEYNDYKFQINEKKKLFGKKSYEISLIKPEKVKINTTLRDKKKNENYWKEHIERLKYDMLEMDFKLKDVGQEYLEEEKTFVELIRLKLLVSLYSAGEDINECKKLYITNLNNIVNSNIKIENYVDLIWYISLGVLFNIEQKEIEILNNMILPKYRNDKLVCFFMNYLKSDNLEGKAYFINEPYSYLERILNDKVEDLKDYMIEYTKKWYSSHYDEYWYSSHKEYGDYFGYWSFELGAIIKIKCLNNESLKDINYYPYDLVCYK